MHIKEARFAKIFLRHLYLQIEDLWALWLNLMTVIQILLIPKFYEKLQDQFECKILIKA